MGTTRATGTAKALLRETGRWSRDTPVAPEQLVSAALGLGGPVAYGVVSAHMTAGMLAAIGALAVSGATTSGGGSANSHATTANNGIRLVYAAATAVAAGLAGAFLGGRGWVTAAAVVVIAAVSSVLGGFSRPAAENSTRFITFLVITTGLGPVGDVLGVAWAFALGTAWALLATLLVTSLTTLSVTFTAHLPSKRRLPTPTATTAATITATATETTAVTASPSPTPRPPFGALLRRWRASLRTMRGWRYPLRLTLCLGIAEAITVLWQQPKAYWIALTVVIVLRREPDGALVMIVQRALGTAAGALLGSALLLGAPPSWLLAPIVAALAALRPLLKARNHAWYATVMTPLVVLLLDSGHDMSPSTIAYRMADTVAGCVIALGAGRLFHPRSHPLPGGEQHAPAPGRRTVPARAGRT